MSCPEVAWLQGYYQEAGRAGRDGKRSECILLYAPRDIPRIVRLLRSGQGRSKAKFDRGFALLNQVCPLQRCNPPCMRGNRMRCIVESTPAFCMHCGHGTFQAMLLKS